jgi:hypothetical protein
MMASNNYVEVRMKAASGSSKAAQLLSLCASARRGVETSCYDNVIAAQFVCQG